jgi:hypothetical protein
MKQRHQPGPPMDLANMRGQGVQHLIAYCLNDSGRHQALIDVSGYPDGVGVPSPGTGFNVGNHKADNIELNAFRTPGRVLKITN